MPIRPQPDSRHIPLPIVMALWRYHDDFAKILAIADREGSKEMKKPRGS